VHGPSDGEIFYLLFSRRDDPRGPASSRKTASAVVIRVFYADVSLTFQ
jgi:hypothetical protein